MFLIGTAHANVVSLGQSAYMFRDAVAASFLLFVPLLVIIGIWKLRKSIQDLTTDKTAGEEPPHV